jgi:hypothetical protein
MYSGAREDPRHSPVPTQIAAHQTQQLTMLVEPPGDGLQLAA